MSENHNVNRKLQQRARIIMKERGIKYTQALRVAKIEETPWDSETSHD